MTSQIPVGNVAFGLAWIFFTNYLVYVLPDFQERVEQCMHNDDIQEYRETSKRKLMISDRLWEIIPLSCKFKTSLAEVDREIKGPWQLPDVEKHIHGTRKVYESMLWRISTEDTDYFFVGEYLNPVTTLYNMHISMIAGLSYEQMILQRQELTEKLREILNTASKMSGKCGIIEFDDTGNDGKSLSSVIVNMISKETGRIQ